MRYVLLVGHARIAEGIVSALEMLMGERDYLLALGMHEGEGPEAFRAKLEAVLAPVEPDDEVVVLADIAGGSPAKVTMALLAERAVACRGFGGVNLPMALATLMAVEEGLDLDAVVDAVFEEGAQAVRGL